MQSMHELAKIWNLIQLYTNALMIVQWKGLLDGKVS